VDQGEGEDQQVTAEAEAVDLRADLVGVALDRGFEGVPEGRHEQHDRGQEGDPKAGDADLGPGEAGTVALTGTAVFHP